MHMQHRGAWLCGRMYTAVLDSACCCVYSIMSFVTFFHCFSSLIMSLCLFSQFSRCTVPSNTSWRLAKNVAKSRTVIHAECGDPNFGHMTQLFPHHHSWAQLT